MMYSMFENMNFIFSYKIIHFNNLSNIFISKIIQAHGTILLITRDYSYLNKNPATKKYTQPKAKFVQDIINNFWKRWMRDYWHTLIIRKKWHVVKRNIRPKDIVLVKDTNALNNWKIAEVVSVDAGRDGLVRTASLRYKLYQPGESYSGLKDKIMIRSVHRLVVLIPMEERN